MKIDGTQIASKIFEELKSQVQKLREKNIIPQLGIILVGDDPASVAYVNQKKIKGEKICAKISIKHISSNTSQKILLSTIEQLNNDNDVHGIIVQQPLPPQINLEKITQAIDPAKDVDGFHLKSKFQPPIALAVFKILEVTFDHLRGGIAPAAHLEAESNKWLETKKIVIIGKGETGGKPIIQMLEKMNLNPIIIDSKTQNATEITKTADIIISTVGKSNIIKPEMIKKGVILVSIGLNKGEDGKLHGDYEEDKIKNLASFYTPTPGGVGPVNVAMLLKNLITSTTIRYGIGLASPIR